MTIVPRLPNSSYRHQPRGKKKRKTKNVKNSVVYKCLNSDNIESFCCFTNFDKSALFKKVLKAHNNEKWCGSAGKLFHGSTTLLLKKMLVLSMQV